LSLVVPTTSVLLGELLGELLSLGREEGKIVLGREDDVGLAVAVGLTVGEHVAGPDTDSWTVFVGQAVLK